MPTFQIKIIFKKTEINHLNLKKVLISRNYRGDVEMNVIERFMQLLLEQEDESNLTPIVQHGDVAFIYIKHTNVYRTYHYFQSPTLILKSYF